MKVREDKLIEVDKRMLASGCAVCKRMGLTPQMVTHAAILFAKGRPAKKQTPLCAFHARTEDELGHVVECRQILNGRATCACAFISRAHLRGPHCV